jgi:hypothetical protein
MTPEQFEIFLERNERSTAASIEKYVNGGIRDLRKMVEDHNAKHEEDMADIRPIISEYKEREAAKSYAKKLGDTVKWSAAVIAALGGIWAIFFKQ